MLLFKSVENFISIEQTFWFSDFVQDTFKIKDSFEIFKSYAFSFVISSITGVLLSGLLVSLLGGYRSLRSLIMMSITSLLACSIGIINGYSSTFPQFTKLNCIFYVLYNISSNFVILLSLLEINYKMKGYAVGFFIFSLQILAFLPAPIVYAELKLYFNSSKKAMKILMDYSAIGVLCMVWSLIYRLIKIFKYLRKKPLIKQNK